MFTASGFSLCYALLHFGHHTNTVRKIDVYGIISCPEMHRAIPISILSVWLVFWVSMASISEVQERVRGSSF